MQDLRAGTVQFNHHPGDKAANLAIIQRFVEQAATQDVQILAFPEMCLTGYWHTRTLCREAIAALAEPILDGPATRQLLTWSARYDMTIGVGLIEEAPDGTLYNAYVVTMSDGTWACHRKLHCFINPHLASGDQYTVFDTPHGCRVGVLICYDNNIVENARVNALMGAEILMAPHQTGGCLSRSPGAMGRIDVALWENRHADPETIEAEFRGPKGREWLLRWLPSRAHDNGMYLLFSNGVGRDDDEVRTGNAMILDTYGQILAETWKAEDTLVVADLKAANFDLSTGRRWLQARRPELYSSFTKAIGNEQATRTVRGMPQD